VATAIRASSAGSRTRSAERRLLVATCSEDAADAVAEILRELGAGGVFIEGGNWQGTEAQEAADGDVTVCAVLQRPEAEALFETFDRALRERVAPWFGPALASLRPAPQVDWVEAYRAHVRAQEVLEGLWVAPPWDVPKGAQALVVEPGAAFGAGDHETTRTCLRLLWRCVRPGDDVIDLGSGTGVLGAAALRRGAGRLRAWDLDPAAVAATRDTLNRNGLVGTVRQGALPARARPADVVLANLSATALRPLLPRLARVVRPGGLLVAGGVLRADRSFAEEFTAAGFTLQAREIEGDWQALLGERHRMG